jgi:hypothetical protein
MATAQTRSASPGAPKPGTSVRPLLSRPRGPAVLGIGTTAPASHKAEDQAIH